MAKAASDRHLVAAASVYGGLQAMIHAWLKGYWALQLIAR